MANNFKDFAKHWELDTDDILTFKQHDDPNSGLQGIWIRRVCLRPNATSDGVQFMTLQPGTSPALTIAGEQVSVTNTSRITDDDSGAAFNGATIGDWLHIWETESGNNKGWFYISAVDGSNNYVDVENGTNALTNENNINYSMKFYTPEMCMILVSPTGDSGAQLIQTEVLDWPEGRFYSNLGMYALSSSAAVDIYLK
jgi:hypothetical protein